MVDSAAATIDRAVAHGRTLVQPIGEAAPEITARVLDPGGNILGLDQRPG
jgi:predicted enzyme related to lactoylglutathione lyase